jgi:fructose-1,6-bisphosphatase
MARNVSISQNKQTKQTDRRKWQEMKLHKLHTGVIITHIETYTGTSVRARHPKDVDYIVWDLLHRTQEFYRRFK